MCTVNFFETLLLFYIRILAFAVLGSMNKILRNFNASNDHIISHISALKNMMKHYGHNFNKKKSNNNNQNNSYNNNNIKMIIMMVILIVAPFLYKRSS